MFGILDRHMLGRVDVEVQKGNKMLCDYEVEGVCAMSSPINPLSANLSASSFSNLVLV